MQNYTIDDVQLSKGYNAALKKGDKIKFRKNNENHTLTLNNFGTNFADITIESNLIELNLSIGESKKINLTSGDYYDLVVKLEGINGVKVNITIEGIQEVIEKPNLTPINNQTTSSNTNKSKGQVYTIQTMSASQNQSGPVINKETKIIVIVLVLAILTFLVTHFYRLYKKSFRHLVWRRSIFR